MQSKFEQMYDMYYDCVYRYIYISVKNKWNTEDIIATVFTKIFENEDKITVVEASKNWIFRIAHNTIIDFYRMNSRVILSENFLDRGVEDFGYEDIVITDEFNGVKKIIDRLPEDTKKMLYLRFYGGLKFREIAEVVNVAESTVKSTVSRTIKKIKKNYEHSLGEKELFRDDLKEMLQDDI
ncbi:RNA polymerase sigma factor [Clostridium estertheticum]|uniref:Sigma-70 family RNA polymerase sigma factor n=1 Tax=Clostridium estertheticum TaxID=238834 RepID=A0A7Y3WSC6_9CLOT|nr:sigma-70 family RNA polymerase sigma factor [Clostridium estertheticum]MBW9169810.1 sigma-70 family RNA polymerase sigma factor [Clostridium estertheticum]NNU75868.1 sigma-70 family RNA polymerase sigma factor [Clostridium estertheticum]WBL46550.1 sigma-70 family RNA polymerase sigma factor [Clostridium estertheticum]WLC74691.1 sigma-70 family RNA polymerase sigma factor [Clostridium estertheticum]